MLMMRTLNFYPRPPRGGRQGKNGLFLACHQFLSTPSARRATMNRLERRVFGSISIHALREEGDAQDVQSYDRSTISIHALREEGDLQQRPVLQPLSISIHALREEGDIWSSTMFRTAGDFYPRPPRGGRPYPAWPKSCGAGYFYPRPPRGGRQQKQRQNLYFLINYTTFCTNLEEL